MAKTVKININGREIETLEGLPVLQTAIDHGIMVPHFCYHPGIGIDGNCRLCLVEVEGMPKLATSCNLPAKEGMVVRTQSAPVEKARDGVLEFFLLNHPLDCPFCDKGGECPLQNFTYDSGQSTTRFEFDKNHKPKHQLIGEHIVLDKERCVLCSRCVRFGRDLAGHEELQITSRGSKSEIFVPPEEPLRSKFTGNYADICPVGALTTREFRFKARPWEMTTVDTVCGDCSLGCNVQAWKKGDDVLRLTPRVEPAVNDWWLCDRGRFSVNRRHGEARILGLHRRSAEGALLPAAGETFVDAMGGRDVGLVADSAMTNEEFFELQALAEKLPRARVYLPISASVAKAYRAVRAAGHAFAYPTDVDAGVPTLVIGETLEDAHPVLAIRLRTAVRKKGLKLHVAHEGASELDGIAAKTDVSSWEKFFAGLSDYVARHGIGQILLSDRVITPQALPSVEKAIAATKVAILFSGANDRGLLDQAGPGAKFADDISAAAHDAWVWYADRAPTPNAAQAGLFVHAVGFVADAHAAAGWVLPREPFFERSGTYTNHFGKVQTLRRATVKVEFGTRGFLKDWNQRLGRAPLTLDEAYRTMAAKLPGYPASRADIPESKQTYHHYERASWR